MIYLPFLSGQRRACGASSGALLVVLLVCITAGSLILGACTYIPSSDLFWGQASSIESQDTRVARKNSRARREVERAVIADTVPPVTAGTLRAALDLVEHDYRLVKFAASNGRSIAPKMARVLEQEGVPSDLLAVVLVESRFMRGQRSTRGAGGLWQFMPATARSLGLEVSVIRDERRDAMKSTRAAARYLRQHYEEFGSFELALAAYNAGAGRVRNALRTHGARSFWELYEAQALPAQTREYVPRVLLARLVVSRLNELNWDVAEDEWDYVLDRVLTFIASAEQGLA